MSLDALVLQHLYARGYMHAADKLKEELGVDEPADNTAAAASRPTLHKLLTSETAPMYAHSYRELLEWVDGSLDAFKPELQQVLFPLFAHCYLALVQSSDAGTRGHAAGFAEEFRDYHTLRHRDELNLLQQVSAKEQLHSHAYAKRMLTQRYEVALSAYARALLLRFLQQARLVLLITLLNQHVTISLSRLQPSAHPGVTAAAAQAWLSLSEDDARRENASEQGWGTLRMVHEKHKEILKVVAPKEAEGEAEGDEPAGSGRDDGKKKRGRKRRDVEKEKESELEASLLEPALPLPPLSDKIERDIVKEGLKRQPLEEGGHLLPSQGGMPNLPSALLLTVLDAHRTLCVAAIAHDVSSIACGFADSAVRVYLLKDKEGQAVARKKRREKTQIAAASADPAPDVAAVAAVDAAGAAGAAAEANHQTDTVVLRGHSGPVYGVSYSRDDNYLVSCSQDGTARLWGLTTRSCLVCYHAHASPAWQVCFSPMGSYFATCGYDRTTRLFTVGQTQPVRLFVGHMSDVRCCAFHPNVSLLATGSDDLSIRVWEVSSAKCVRLLCRGGHAAPVCALAISNDGALLASGGDDHAVLLWQLAEGRLLRRLSGHLGSVWSVHFSVEGSQLVSASADCSLGVWDVTAAAAPVSDPDGPAEGTGGMASGGAGGAGGGRSREVAPFLHRWLHTKHTPVVVANFTRSNLLLAAGAYSAPDAE